MTDEIFIGKYNIRVRDHYVAYRTEKYMIDHPGVSEHKAKKYARVAWKRKASGQRNGTKDTPIPAKNTKNATELS